VAARLNGVMSDPNRAPHEPLEPDVMFLPLAAVAGDWGDRDPALIARRVPDFVHQLLNRGQPGPTAMLELQTVTGDGPVTWIRLDAAPDREDAFAMLPPELDVRAVVTGEVAVVDNGLRFEFAVHHDDEAEESVTAKVGGVVPFDDPVPALLRLVRHLAHLLDVEYHEPPRGLLTRNGAAFEWFLRGLDSEKLLSGDLDITVPDDREALLRPFAEALALDPSFGLALRVANSTAAVALESARVDDEAVRRFLDRCYAVQPADGDACVAVAEQLTDMGDDDRAFAWLQHAAHLDPPPPRGLENLGLLLARRGDRAEARGLWQRGIDVDGHPDFFSHLAQLSFAEGRDDDAWTFLVRGLRRLRERTVRAAEWDDGERGNGVLLECLHAQLGRRQPPQTVADALGALRTLLVGEERVVLGLCLLAVGERAAARTELVAALRNVVDLDVRDLGVRAMLRLDVADFEGRFARATDRALRARNPRPAIAEFQLWLHLQPEFWPALYFSAIAKGRTHEHEEALDLLAAALEVAPGQPDVLYAMAEGFDRRRNPKRALELVDEALSARPREARLLGARVRYLRHLGRLDEAREGLRVARALGCDSPELRKLARRLGA
jgi:tetratricopeptide (TPR) repeat protein